MSEVIRMTTPVKASTAKNVSVLNGIRARCYHALAKAQHRTVLRFLPSVPRAWHFLMYSGANGILHEPTNSTSTFPIASAVLIASSARGSTYEPTAMTKLFITYFRRFD